MTAEPTPKLQTPAEPTLSAPGSEAASTEQPPVTPASVDPGPLARAVVQPGAAVPPTGSPVAASMGYPLPQPVPRPRFGIGFLAGFLTATTLALLVGGGVAVATAVNRVSVRAIALTPGQTATPTGLPSGSAIQPPGPDVSPSGNIHPNDLASYAIPVPPNSRPWRGKPTDEPLNLDQAAALSKNPTARAEVLRRYDFQRAFARHWINSTGTIVEDRLYQFSGTALAAEFFQEDVLLNSTQSWGTPSDVAAVPGGKAFIRSAADADGYQHTLSMALNGDIVVCVFATELPPADSTQANQVLADQNARL
jgi:hypothetical protein